ncbi:MAG: hypothetical protein ACOC8X_13870 [Chloroflexota bacterium]
MPPEQHDESIQEVEPVAVMITLKEHLDALQAEENRKAPSERRPVPTLAELAEAVNISRQGMYNFAGGDVKLVNRELLADIINELQRRGFTTDVPDLLKAYPQNKVIRQ